MSLLDALFRAGALRTLDHALAQSLRRLDPSTPDPVLAAAALASLAVGHGHAGLDLARPQLLFDGAIDWPTPQHWREILAASGWVGTPEANAVAATDAPLVLEQNLLYLRRYREYERRLAAGLQRIAAQPREPLDSAALAPLFAALFPHARSGSAHDDGGQARAAALALLRPLLLVSGGPGTGKTTTIARLLLLLLEQARQAGREPPRIALAAPTGRAAERMAASLRKATAQLRETAGIDPTLCDALPIDARTLHRLLGTIPDSPRFRHHADAPLPFDVVVVDEASMVDLPLMCKLVEAVAVGARLILLGDRDQLPSVEAGDVLAAIVDAAGEGDALPPELLPLFNDPESAFVPQGDFLRGVPQGDFLRGVRKKGLPSVVGAASAASSANFETDDEKSSRLKPLLQSAGNSLGEHKQTGILAGHRVHLRRGYRQSETLDLAPLAAATREGDADTVLDLLRGDTLDGVHFHEGLLDPLAGAAREMLLASWRDIATAPDAKTALDLAGRVRLLTALRDGPQGAQPLNARIEEALAGAHRPAYFHGRLLLITENNYRLNLFNGDIGVCQRDDNGAIVAWFAGGSQGERGFHPAALPAHTGAFAMTVHKAQGSEFDSVWLQLPRQDARTLSRELVYTALTRARSELHVCASEQVLRAALARHAARVSGLAWRLRNA